jgi:ATP-dependent DNA helicase RecG
MIEIKEIKENEFKILLRTDESHFFDFKQKTNFDKIAKTASAFANADGGDLYIGIADKKEATRISGFYENPEDANGHIREIVNIFAAGVEFCRLQILKSDWISCTFFVHAKIDRTPFIVKTPRGEIYKRLNASDIQVTGGQINALEMEKGVISHEDYATECEVTELYESPFYKEFSKNVVPQTEPNFFFSSEYLVTNSKARVAAVVLFANLPQGIIAQSSVKVYRYKTLAHDPSRDDLDG